MLSKNKTIFACTVKLLLCATLLQAQTVRDSLKQDTVKLISFNTYLLKQPVNPNMITGNFYARQLPFFCTKELQVQKATGFSIKFRLGSVEYCDKLEGKNSNYSINTH